MLADEQRKLVDGLQMEVEPDSPLALVLAVEREESITKEEVPEDILDRIEDTERNLESAKEALASITANLEVLPAMLNVIQNGGKLVSSPHESEAAMASK